MSPASYRRSTRADAGSSRRALCIAVLLVAGSLPCLAADPAVVLLQEFIEAAPADPEVHASTLVETSPGNFYAAWFGGTMESKPDVSIWGARRTADGWQPAVKLAEGRNPEGEPVPTWNPVLFRLADGIALFHSAGSLGGGPRVGYLQRSGDGGKTWGRSIRLPAGIRGPDRNRPLRLDDGTVLHPDTDIGSSSRVVISDGAFSQWEKRPRVGDPEKFGAIQPVLLDHGMGRIQMLCRSPSRRIVTSWSEDGGKNWGPFSATSLTMANSAIDAIRLADGRFVLAYNPTPPVTDGKSWGSRDHMALAVSRDGLRWEHALDLDTDRIREGYAYPCLVQAESGELHVTYTWGRKRIKHVVIDAKRLRQP